MEAYYGIPGCARALGVTRQRFQQLVNDGKIPPPDAVAEGQLLWQIDKFMKFVNDRLVRLANTPGGLIQGGFDIG